MLLRDEVKARCVWDMARIEGSCGPQFLPRQIIATLHLEVDKATKRTLARGAGHRAFEPLLAIVRTESMAALQRLRSRDAAALFNR